MSEQIISAFQLQTINTMNHGPLTLNNFDQELYKRINNGYYGIGGFEDGSYLTEFPAEDSEDYIARKEYASFDNVFQPEIDYKTNPVFAKNISRTIINKRLTAFSEKANKAGDDLSAHISDVMSMLELNTTVFEIITSPNGQIRDNNDMSILPYAITVTPLKCSGYYKDSSGDLVLLAYQTGQRNSDGITYNIYNVWEKGLDGEGYFYRLQGVATDKSGFSLDYSKNLSEMTEAFPVKMYPVKMIECAIPIEITEAPPAKYNTISKQLQTAYNLDNMTIKGMANVCFSPVTYQTKDGSAPEEAQIGDNNVLGYAEGLEAPRRMAVETAHFAAQEDKYQGIIKSILKQMDSLTQISDNSSEGSRKEAGRKIINNWMSVAKKASSLEKWIFEVIQANYVNSNEKVIINYSTDYSSLTPDLIIENAALFIETFGLQGSAAEKLIYDNTAKEVYGDDPDFADKLTEAFKQGSNKINGGDNDGDNDVNDE
jgi:hypothetical protein